MSILFSGIKPTGQLHLGNYLGAIKNWVALQDQYSCIFFLADLHALTIEISANALQKNTRELAIDLLALGIDPRKSILFKQSEINGHSELAWIFDCLIPVAELERMTQYKDMSARQPKNVNAGLLTYPALQAADILLYGAEYVPVGEDQLQHLELTRIALRKFNKRYGQFFAEVKPIVSENIRLMALNAPDKKMSKSLGEASYIAIRDDAQTVTKKIKKAVADKDGVINLLELYKQFGEDKKYQAFSNQLKAKKLMNSELKDALSEAIIKFLSPIQEKMKYYEAHPQEVEKILADGAKKAQIIADKNLREIKKLVGLI